MVLFSCLLALLLCTAILVGYRIRLSLAGRPDMPRLGSSPGSVILPGWVVEAFYWSFHAPARLLVRLGVDPDVLTYLSLVLSLASAPLLAFGHFEPAAAVLIVGALLDALDGMVARARGRASPAGAVLDSCLDRIADAAPLAGLALFYRHHAPALAVILLALVASSLVSYARAKADIYRLTLPAGVMRRHERLGYLIAALIVAPLWPTLGPTGALPYPVLVTVLAFIGTVGLGAGFLLIHRTRAALRAPSIPAPTSTRKVHAVKTLPSPIAAAATAATATTTTRTAPPTVRLDPNQRVHAALVAAYRAHLPARPGAPSASFIEATLAGLPSMNPFPVPSPDPVPHPDPVPVPTPNPIPNPAPEPDPAPALIPVEVRDLHAPAVSAFLMAPPTQRSPTIAPVAAPSVAAPSVPPPSSITSALTAAALTAATSALPAPAAPPAPSADLTAPATTPVRPTAAQPAAPPQPSLTTLLTTPSPRRLRMASRRLPQRPRPAAPREARRTLPPPRSTSQSLN
ncbi:CDP-alcohol phosphatidyltransferase family protein [Chondromyces apiculatus]|uniref:CDP-diacylglycerol--glycerol-3-phosphate 3-phosphatidyltransferase n=1 Tax=Chondromyces apiculatus DSM 436 TaxID=1192034 RepID=A0A017SWC3_9BACT|nr:CDP-alcohol phosphatidyltransferase family protein [Chondromyces apiculatus]EYF00586.1 Hypothetical protein CAP_0457 [Chondromyces apiculatus DSM 436]